MPHYRAEILTIFCPYFARNDNLINLFRNLLTFSCYNYKTGGLKWLVNLQIQWPGSYYIDSIHRTERLFSYYFGIYPANVFVPNPMGLPTVWLYDGNIDIFYPIAHQQYTMVSVSPVQPSLNLEFLHTYLENLQNVSIYWIWKNAMKRPIS